MKFLLFIALLIFGYLYIKKSISRFFGTGPGGSSTTPKPPIIDELVQDPVCGVYVPKKEAIVYGRGGKLYYFCCEKCLKKFKKKKT